MNRSVQGPLPGWCSRRGWLWRQRFRRRLASIELALAADAPRLAVMFEIFGQLAEAERAPREPYG